MQSSHPATRPAQTTSSVILLLRRRGQLFFDDFFFEDFFFDALPPSLRASDNPIAMACFLLVTFFPDPLFRVPSLRSCIAFLTFCCAFFPYLAISSPHFFTFGKSSNGVGVGLGTGSGSGTGVAVPLGEGLGDGTGVAVGVGVGDS